MKRAWLILPLWLLFLTMIGWFPAVDFDRSDASNLEYLRIFSLGRLTRKLIIGRPGFYRSDLRLKNPALESYDMVEVKLLSKEGQVLASHRVSGKNIDDPDWVRFDWGNQFPQGEYELVLEMVELVDGKLEVGLKESKLVVNNYYRLASGPKQAITVTFEALRELLVDNTWLALGMGLIYYLAVKNVGENKK